MVPRLPPRGFLLSLASLLVLIACDNRAGELATGVPDATAGAVITPNKSGPPEVRIESPANGASVSGTVAISVRAKAGGAAVSRTDLFIGGELVTSSTQERFTYNWNTAGLSGSQSIRATAVDVQGASASASITVTVAGGGTPPPPSIPTPSSVSLDPATVVAGETSTGTVVLSAAAPAGGTEVSVRSNNTTVATVPPSITVPEGETTGTFLVTTHPVASGTGLAISVNSGGTTRTASFWVNPAGVTMDSLTLSPTTVASGETSTATVRLTGPAPEGGAVVTLVSNDTQRATVPPSVTVPAGQTTATFAVTAQTVQSTVSVSVEASYGGVMRFARLTVTPPPPSGGQLASLTINPNLVVGGESAQGTVTLGAASASPTQVVLTSTDVSVATVPSSVTVPAGAIGASFTITTLPNTTGQGQSSWISGEAGGETRGAGITTTGAPSGPAMSALQLFPSTVGGGGPATGIITFNGSLSDGVLFDFHVSHPDIVTILNLRGDGPAGERQGQRIWSSNQRAFAITTNPVPSNTSVTITATACCGAVGQRTATLLVTTNPPPPPDVVRITSARWRPGGSGGTLEVRAESTSSTALLTVYMVSIPDRFLLYLQPVGGGRYEGSQTFGGGMTNPGQIEIRSNLGGRATSQVRQ